MTGPGVSLISSAMGYAGLAIVLPAGGVSHVLCGEAGLAHDGVWDNCVFKAGSPLAGYDEGIGEQVVLGRGWGPASPRGSWRG